MTRLCCCPERVSNCVQKDSALAACDGADALVIPTPWPEFRQVDLRAVRAAMRGRIIIDPFGMVNGPQAVELGFDHYRLGVQPSVGKGIAGGRGKDRNELMAIFLPVRRTRP